MYDLMLAISQPTQQSKYPSQSDGTVQSGNMLTKSYMYRKRKSLDK